MATTLSSDNSDLVSLFVGDDVARPSSVPSHFGNALAPCRNSISSPTSTKLSDDSKLTTDDLVVLSDLLGLVAPKPSTSSKKADRSTSARPRCHKRPRQTFVAPEGVALPKSQQQRQKLEIEYLKKQIVEMEATVERMQARKLERERRELEKSQLQDVKEMSMEVHSNAAEWMVFGTEAVQQLDEQNEKLRSQVASHLDHLNKLELVARNRFFADVSTSNRQCMVMQATSSVNPAYWCPS